MHRARLAVWLLAGAGVLALAALLLGGPGEESGMPAGSGPPEERRADPGPVDAPDAGPNVPDRAAGASRRDVPDDFVPPEVLAAAEGRGEPAAPVAGAVPARPEVRIGDALPERGTAPTTGPDAARHPPSFEGLDEAPTASRSVSETERARRQRWTENQRRRNSLRVERMTAEFGLDAAEAARFGEILDASLASKVALYETLDPGAIDQNALTTGLEEIRRTEATALIDLLGRARFEKYKELDEQGVFVLPEEKQKPPGG